MIIAFRYLIPRQKTENGLDEARPLEFSDDAVRFIVQRYTREAGVRNLEREIGNDLPQDRAALRRRQRADRGSYARDGGEPSRSA